LLLSQQQGKNPSLLGDVVFPMLDLGPFYDQERLEVKSETRTASAVGNSDEITVPQAEAWRLLNVSARATHNTIGATIRLGLFTSVGGSDFVMIGEGGGTAVGATDIFTVSANLQGAIFPPGSQFGMLVEQLDLNAGANISVVTTALVVRMTV
jgi:hypothetical protein